MDAKTNWVCDDMPIDTYHHSGGLSNSAITYLLDCPYKYWHLYLNPTRTPKQTNQSFRFGKLLHTLILENEKFEGSYYISEKIRRDPRSKKWQEVLTLAQDREIIFQDEYDRLVHVQTELHNHPTLLGLLSAGIAEQSLFWVDADTQILCKARPDYHNTLCICDLKTTQDASPKGFQKSLYRYGYYRQAAMYLDGLKATKDIVHDNFVFIAVEKEPPYLTAFYLLDEDDIEQGRREYKRGLEIYKRCQEQNHWPGYGDELQSLTLPHWAFDEVRREQAYGVV